MRRGIGAVIGMAVIGGSLTGIGFGTPPAQAATVSIEKGLLGVRLLQSYRDVYKKFGQPARVYLRNQMVDYVDSLDANGTPTGAILGLDSNTVLAGGPNGNGANPYGGRGMPGGPMAGGYRGMNGQPGMPGMPGAMPGMPGAMPGMPGGKQDGMPGGPYGMGRPGGYPGMQGGRPFPGANPGNGIGTRRAGMTGNYGGQNEETFRDAGGFIWVYWNAKQQNAYFFFFNRDGRVDLINEYGKQGGSKTARGLALGQPVSAVYAAYGWPDSTDQYGRFVSLYYGPSHHVQVTVINNKVVGIDVMLREDEKLERMDRGSNNTAMGGRGPMAGRGVGAPLGGMPYGAPGGYGGRGLGRKDEE